jgi:hypothetical protein
MIYEDKIPVSRFMVGKPRLLDMLAKISMWETLLG